MGRYLLSFGAALATALAATPAVRAGARKLGFVAKPRADRWHRKPTALLGGVAIFVGFLASWLAVSPHQWRATALLVACASGMFVLGLVDDVVQLRPYAKLVGQIVVCTVYTMFGLRLNWLPSAPWADQAVTIFWLVGMTNAVNLLDNLDGLAGGVAAIAAGYLVYFSDAGGQTGTAMLAAGLSGALVGFLVYNFNPASVFMGDSGSLFLGFFLGGVALVQNSTGLRRNVLAVLAIPVLVLLIPIVDTTMVTINRKLHGLRVSQGGRDHTSHRLVALGLSERSAALVLWTLAAASGACAVLVRNLSWSVAALVLPLFVMVVLFFSIFVGRVKIYAPVRSEDEGAGRAMLPTLADFTYKRRIFEVLNDLVLIVTAYWAAYLLRWDGAIVHPFYDQFLATLPMVIVMEMGAFLALGLYQGLWRYTSINDLMVQGRAVGGAWVASTLAVAFGFHYPMYSRGVLVMNGVLLFIGVSGSRLSFRVLRNWLARAQPSKDSRRTLIYGAGDGGELLVRELQNNRELGFHPVGFVDDDPQKEGRVIHGIRVLGPLDRLNELVGREKATDLLISTSRLSAERSEQVSQLCAAAGVSCRRMRIALE